jgi:sec-independent protein translocase protein TatA
MSVFNIGPAEMIVILLIALVVFGPKRLPEIGRTVGKSLREFRRATQDLRDEFEGTLDADEAAPPDAPAADASTATAPPKVETTPNPDGSSSSSDGSGSAA